MRGRLLFATALLLVLPGPVRADEAPRAEALRLLAPEPAVHEGLSVARPALRRADASVVVVFALGATRFEAIMDGLAPAERLLALAAMRRRGWRLVELAFWTDAPRSPGEQDAAALVAADGALRPGYVPAGREAPGEIPPLPVLGGTVVLEIVDGRARARLTDVPPGSRAQEIGLREGDALLEVDGQPVGPAALATLNEEEAGGGQHTLRVRRTHGGIELVEIDSRVRLPSR